MEISKMEEAGKFAIIFLLVNLGYNQNFSATAASIPTNDKCASQICPKSDICPKDSFLPQKEWYDLYRGDASLSIDRRKQDLVDYCCTRDRCICHKCPSGPTFQDVLKCKEGQVLLVVKLGNGQPGTCCDQYQCGEKPICGDHKNLTKYYKDECTTCDSCVWPLCEALCSVEERRTIVHCWLADKGEIKKSGTNWTEQNGCVQCRCENGIVSRTGPSCMQVDCPNPKKIEGECCPFCSEDDEIKKPLPIRSESPAPSKNDMEKVESTSTSTLAPVVSDIDGISIDQSTPLVATSNENKNSTESIELLITDSINSTEMPELDTNTTTTTIASSTTENDRNLESYTEDFERNSSMITYIDIEDDGKIQPSNTTTFNIPPEESSSSTENPSTSANLNPDEIQTKNDEEESEDNENNISNIDTEEQSEDSENDNSDIPDTDDNTDSSLLIDGFDEFEISISISSSSSSSSRITDDDDGTSSTTSTPMSSSISASSAVPTPESSLNHKATMDRNYRTTEGNQNNDTSTNSHDYTYIYIIIVIGFFVIFLIICIIIIAIKIGKKPKKMMKRVYSKVPGSEQNLSQMTDTSSLFNSLCGGSDKD